jgi:hypothetical protein
MKINSQRNENLLFVNTLEELVSTSFEGKINALSWKREIEGDYEEIVHAFEFQKNIIEIDPADLKNLTLSEAGSKARNTLLNDYELLQYHGASPVLNIIKYYEEDTSFPFFPTDVYSYHVDRSPIATDTFLCTYFGSPSELIPNEQAIQKITIPEIREQLLTLFEGESTEFESILSEHFFDLHYEAKPNIIPFQAEIGHIWRLAVEHPSSKVLPCVHRAPRENGKKRLLLIC